jgi:7-cyano-7-deazaguanine reductase
MITVHDSPLGKPSVYAGHYDRSRLFPIPRAAQRAALGVIDPLPFFGGDIWNAYELSWLDPRGRPRVALARFDVPAHSPCIIESKSLKLYLNGFMQERLASADEVTARLLADLSHAAGSTVAVEVLTPDQFAGVTLSPLGGALIDNADADIDHYGPPLPELLVAHHDLIVSEVLTTNTLKSNCPVTGQPDWASLQIRYRGPRIGRAALLRYVASYREHADFHEHCVERIYLDLLQRCAPADLFVQARYTRRGGLDINPWRSSQPCPAPDNRRTPRQ